MRKGIRNFSVILCLSYSSEKIKVKREGIRDILRKGMVDKDMDEAKAYRWIQIER